MLAPKGARDNASLFITNKILDKYKRPKSMCLRSLQSVHYKLEAPSKRQSLRISRRRMVVGVLTFTWHTTR